MHRSESRRRARVRFEIVPKPGGVRLLSRLEPGLAAAYSGAVARVCVAVEHALGPEVVANRVALVSRTPPTVMLHGWRASRSSLEAVWRGWPADRDVLRTDVVECYASIHRGVVAEALRRAGVAPAATSGCVRVLEELGAEGVPGLPIGPPASAVLANAVLAVGDAALRRAGVPFARWVDDWWIGVRSTDAAGALALLGEALAGVGLRLNDAKTAFVLDGVGSAPTAEYHRAADAHAVPVVAGSHARVPDDRRVGAGGRAARAANRRR